MIDNPIVDNLVQVNIFRYDIDFLDGITNEELVKRCFGKHSKTDQLKLYNSRNCLAHSFMVSSKPNVSQRVVVSLLMLVTWRDV